MSGRTDIVVTTIWEPAWLRGYLDNLRAHGREDAVTIRIICDRKTPASVYRAAQQARRAGFKVDCPTLDEQSRYLQKLGLPARFVPWNTDNRRNIGFLRAWQDGASTLVSIDDDNYCVAGSDFVGAHLAAGRRVGDLGRLRVAQGPWFNVCSRLRGAEHTYPRGFPYAARGPATARLRQGAAGRLRHKRVAVNVGLWLDDPDVDAIARLALRPRARRARAGAILLDAPAWSPINTQNTAIVRDALPAYYYVRMGFPLQGMKLDRFGDILSGYFLQKCVKHMGDVIRVGSPVAVHTRTPHNLMVDLYHELAGIVLVEDLLPWLRELRLAGNSYPEAYAALAEALEREAGRFRGFVWDQGGRDFLRETARHMRTWLAALKRAGR